MTQGYTDNYEAPASVQKFPLDEWITSTTEWIRLSDIPSVGSEKASRFWSKFPSSTGVYLLAREESVFSIGNSFTHKDIGYIGSTDDVPSRLYNAGVKGHGVGKYLAVNNISKDQVCARILFTNSEASAKDLESQLHKQNQEAFGEKFAWIGASAGKGGAFTRALNDIHELSADQLVELGRRCRELHSVAAAREHLEKFGGSW